MNAFFSGYLRILGAFHAGVAMYVVPHGNSHAFLIALITGAVVFWRNCDLDENESLRVQFVLAYLVPQGLIALLFLFFAAPSSWEAALSLVLGMHDEAWTRTPGMVYLLASAYGSYRAHVAQQSQSF
ncbi:hypothetical protein GobsT_26010 [Gemmata obscuriglobus]|uniref:Uncharacterized protein n=1 Tax=Gemmata obscuriglobus TaxID=114 RepID=A0A2Z3GXB0_9BACT|nr:hypothetical protein [Gemmata obscuriglobus]AWM39119.1 hypothetical protein C1280_20445 [Gemmata obscuriglobus]QEG27837.1 hypothetical protein GobsT_26010 [Gemmata obscuriglobus]VTS05200.1 unnamed protein product [Gemmata obscuriglobus UQM 2246]